MEADVSWDDRYTKMSQWNYRLSGYISHLTIIVIIYDYVGNATRLCTINNKWSDQINILDCERIEFVELSNLVNLVSLAIILCTSGY